MSFFSKNTQNQSPQPDVTTLADNLENCVKSGSNFRAKCPICGSNSARPFVLFENGGYFCHSCNEKGGVFGLIKDVFNLSVKNFKNILDNINPFSSNKKAKTPNFRYKQKEFHKPIQANKERIFELVYKLIPEETKDLKLEKLNRFVGYDDKNDTLAISLINEKGDIVNIKRRSVGTIKWLGLKGGDGRFAPHRITGQKFVYVASGIAEFMILHSSSLDYIVMQSDGIDINHLLPRGVTAVILEDNDKKDIVNEEDRRYQCYKNPDQFNPFKKKVTEKIIGEKIAIDFEKILNKEVQAKYDLRDFINDEPENWLGLIEKEINRITNMPKKIEVKEEIVTNYTGDYPDYIKMETGVSVSRTFSGKTHYYEGIANILIIVPRESQCNIFKGDSLDALLDKIYDNGAIITFHKFYGHYTTNLAFRNFIDSKKIELVVDEAHKLTEDPSLVHQLIYNLDAIFLSGTLQKFFRRDLQRYKYKPETPEIIYYTTNGELPKGYNPLVFIDNAKLLKTNYPNNCVVGKQHNFNSVNIHTTTKNMVFTTSALGEGVSVKNPNFNACMVFVQQCPLWSNKQKIQAVYRVRKRNALRIISAPPKPQYTKNIDYDWWENFINSNTEDTITNTIMGEHYSKMMNITHKLNNYQKADEYSIVCYLSHLTRDNYDEDFYKFVEYKEDFEPLEINTKIETINSTQEDEEMFNHVFENGEEWKIPKNKKKAFKRWLESEKSGLIDKLIKLNKFKNLNEIYLKSNVSKKIKAKYNQLNKHKKKKYSIKMFYKLLRSLVQIEMINDKTGRPIKRVGSKTDLKNISIRIINRCFIVGVEVVKNAVKKAKKWLDGLGDSKKVDGYDYNKSLSAYEMEVNLGNCETNLEV